MSTSAETCVSFDVDETVGFRGWQLKLVELQPAGYASVTSCPCYVTPITASQNAEKLKAGKNVSDLVQHRSYSVFDFHTGIPRARAQRFFLKDDPLIL